MSTVGARPMRRILNRVLVSGTVEGLIRSGVPLRGRVEAGPR
jgi:hypothetical protein